MLNSTAVCSTADACRLKCWQVCLSAIKTATAPVADSKGALPIDWMHLKTSENFARKCTILHAILKHFRPPLLFRFLLSKILDLPLQNAKYNGFSDIRIWKLSEEFDTWYRIFNDRYTANFKRRRSVDVW